MLAEAERHQPSVDGAFGFVHSFTTGSAVDGPGLRTVLWTTGCQMRCLYCHNPDMWHVGNGRRVAVGDAVAEIAKYTRFMARSGGVTISGGEPLVQARFVTNVLRGCHERGIHTALDTNGLLGEQLSDADLAAIDLVLLDIKSWEPATHRQVTGQDITPVLRFARRLAELGKPAWIRFVLVPGLTDAAANVEGLAEFVATLPNVERIEVLPFHQMGAFKWRQLGLCYTLENTLVPAPVLVARVESQLRAHGLPVM